MNDRERARRLRAALKQLEQAKEPYVTHPHGPRWEAGRGGILAVVKDLERPRVKVPQLGPVVAGGLSVMLLSPTHKTDGVSWPDGEIYPAIDTGMGAGGRPILAVEALKVTRGSSAQGGDAFYATGVSGIRYWYGHLDVAPAVGRTFRKGERVGRIKFGPGQPPGGPHTHLGLDVTPLKIATLKYGRTGRGPDYTFGSPTIGAQLTKALAS